MAKQIENEVKVLDIDVKLAISNIEKNNGILVNGCIQKIYTYDLGTIGGRFDDLLRQFTSSNFSVMKAKFVLLFSEIDNLLSEEDSKNLYDYFKNDKLSLLIDNITNNNDLELFVNTEIVKNIANSFGINPNKWIRLRETNNLSTLTTKHILKRKLLSDNQEVLETEIDVTSIEEANEFLEQLGFVYRNYQEKRRITYSVNGVEVDIDFWPLIPPYIEIEDKDSKKIEDIINLLDLANYEIVSCNTEQVYKKYGMNIYDYRELRLNEENRSNQNLLEHNRKL